MNIEADYDRAKSDSEELDYAEYDSLPWLEAEEEDDDRAGGFDFSQLAGLIAILVGLTALFVGLVYFFSNYGRGPVEVADGSLIEAPDGPYKERPENAGGKEFAGTDDVAPGVGQGLAPDGRIADTGAGSGDQDLPPVGGAGSETVASSAATGAQGASTSSDGSSSEAAAGSPSSASTSSSTSSGVGVQVGAFSSRARAEQGWTTLRRQSAALSGFDKRIVEGQADRGSVFRLQAVAPTLAEANSLCAALKRDGLDCQVKP